MGISLRRIFCLLALCECAAFAAAQARPLPGNDVQQIYRRILPQIEKIPIFDHHAHPGFFDDPDVDAMAAPPGSAALRERDSNPELVAAAKALFGYPYDDLSPEHANWLIQKKAELKSAQGKAYFSNILDKLNIERGVANRHDGRLPRSQTFPLGVFRRRFHVAFRQPAAACTQS